MIRQKETDRRPEVAASKGPWSARETGFNCSVIEYHPQEIAHLNDAVGMLREEIVQLARYGTKDNRDIFARRFESIAGLIQAGVEKGRMM
jgi:hypothetical protein